MLNEKDIIKINKIEEGKKKKPTPVLDSLNVTHKDATIIFSDRAAAKLFALLLLCDDTEVAWHGSVDRIETGKYRVDDIYLYPQSTSGVTVNSEEYGLWQYNTLLNEPEKIEKMCLHGHSHVNMKVSPSGVDLDYQADTIEMVQPDCFYIFMIVNRRFEYYFRIIDRADGVEYKSAKIDTDSGALLELSAQYKECIKENTYSKTISNYRYL